VTPIGLWGCRQDHCWAHRGSDEENQFALVPPVPSVVDRRRRGEELVLDLRRPQREAPDDHEVV